ncbi:MAG TPA: hypothetical protein DDW65_21040 [Firmicutes bacterium]|jgi:hypothetical protein|nr:hypothetical protein [Bacillota bacterium]
MNRLVRGIVTGSVIGATIGLVMLTRKKSGVMKNMNTQADQLNKRTHGTVRMVRDNAMRWTSAVKSGTEAFSRKLAHRTS